MERDASQWASGQWIVKFEEFTFQYLGYLFRTPEEIASELGKSRILNGGDDPLAQKRVINDILDEIIRIESQLDEDHISGVLPLMANLTFLKKQNFTLVNTSQLMNMLTSFKKTAESSAYRALDMDTQLSRVVDFVDNIRRFAEFLLKTAVPLDIDPEPVIVQSKSEFTLNQGVSQQTGQTTWTENTTSQISERITNDGNDATTSIIIPASSQGWNSSENPNNPRRVSEGEGITNTRRDSNDQNNDFNNGGWNPNDFNNRGRSGENDANNGGRNLNSSDRTSNNPNNDDFNNGGCKWSRNPDEFIRQLQSCLCASNQQNEDNVKTSRKMAEQAHQACCSSGQTSKNKPPKNKSCPCPAPDPCQQGRPRQAPVPRARRRSKKCSPPCPKEPREPTNDERWCPLMVCGASIKDNFPSVTYFPNIRELNIPGQKIFDCAPKCAVQPPPPRNRQQSCEKPRSVKKPPLPCAWRDECEAQQRPKKKNRCSKGGSMTIKDIMMSLSITPENLENLATYPNITPEMQSLIMEMLKAVAGAGNTQGLRKSNNSVDVGTTAGGIHYPEGNDGYLSMASSSPLPPLDVLDFTSQTGKDAEVNTDLRKPREPFNVQVGAEVRYRNVPMTMNNQNNMKKSGGNPLSEKDAELLILLLASKADVLKAATLPSTTAEQISPQLHYQTFTKGIQTEGGHRWIVKGEIIAQDFSTQASINDLLFNQQDNNTGTSYNNMSSNVGVAAAINEDSSPHNNMKQLHNNQKYPPYSSVSVLVLAKTCQPGGGQCETKKMFRTFSDSNLTRGVGGSSPRNYNNRTTLNNCPNPCTDDISPQATTQQRGNYISPPSLYGNACRTNILVKPPTFLIKSEKSVISHERKTYSKIQARTPNRNNDTVIRKEKPVEKQSESKTKNTVKKVTESKPLPPTRIESVKDLPTPQIVEKAPDNNDDNTTPTAEEETLHEAESKVEFTPEPEVQEIPVIEETSDTSQGFEVEEVPPDVDLPIEDVGPSEEKKLSMEVVKEEETNISEFPEQEKAGFVEISVVDRGSQANLIPEEVDFVEVGVVERGSQANLIPVEVVEESVQTIIPEKQESKANLTKPTVSTPYTKIEVPPPPPPPKTKRKTYKSPHKFTPVPAPVVDPMCALHQLEELPDWHPLKTAYPPQFRLDERKLQTYMAMCMLNPDQNGSMNYMGYQNTSGTSGYPPQTVPWGQPPRAAPPTNNGYPYPLQSAPPYSNYPPPSSVPPWVQTPWVAPPPPQDTWRKAPPPQSVAGPYGTPPPPPIQSQLNQLPPLPQTPPPPPPQMYRDNNFCAFKNVVYPNMVSGRRGPSCDTTRGQPFITMGQYGRPGLCHPPNAVTTPFKNASPPPNPHKVTKYKKKYIPCNCPFEIDPCLKK